MADDWNIVLNPIYVIYCNNINLDENWTVLLGHTFLNELDFLVFFNNLLHMQSTDDIFFGAKISNLDVEQITCIMHGKLEC